MHRLSVALPPFLLGLALAGGVFFAADSFSSGDSNSFLLWLSALGVVIFAYYGWDKFRSIRSGRRIPEWTLHGLALAGGVAGGWLGMFLFRHKTQKPVFRLVLLAATLLWGWLVLR
jgi:uncharacterized membrane protein YsdA (DUF1294 family)